MLQRGANIFVRWALITSAALSLSCVVATLEEKGNIATVMSSQSVDLNLSANYVDIDTPMRAVILGAEQTSYSGEFCNNVQFVSDRLFISTQSGLRDIYLFAHEGLNSGLEGDSTQEGLITLSQMREAKIAFEVDRWDPTKEDIDELKFPSTAQAPTTLILPDPLNEIDDMELVRRTAKVDLNLTYTMVKPEHSHVDFEILTVQIVDIPHYCYWLDNTLDIRLRWRISTTPALPMSLSRTICSTHVRLAAL